MGTASHYISTKRTLQHYFSFFKTEFGNNFKLKEKLQELKEHLNIFALGLSFSLTIITGYYKLGGFKHMSGFLEF